MTARTFNASLLVGLLLVMVGVGWQWTPALALIVGGALVLSITLLLAFKAGVTAAPAAQKGRTHVPQ